MKTGLFMADFSLFTRGTESALSISSPSAPARWCWFATDPGQEQPHELRAARSRDSGGFPQRILRGIQRLPDPNYDLCVYVGREVGYETIKLDAGTEAISATKIRNGEET